ncbi:MAG: tRNA epoxyqueuosine(34) reductase QueG [Acidimicrobiales bacterium]
MPPDHELAADLRRIGLGAGLDDIGFTDASVLEPARSVLTIRKAAGLAGTMQFTYRNPERSTDPGRVLDGARSIVAGLRRYPTVDPPRPAGPVARVARYARVDHYGALREALDAVADELRSRGFTARVHLDDNRLVDRNVAARAGLGWYGKNANLLSGRHGSWVVLGNVVTDAVLPPAEGPVADGCGPCRACVDDCPTGAIVGPGVVDARRCLAWIVQGPGEIPRAFRAAVADRIYGCDDCQEVCPPNRGVARRVDGAAASNTDADTSLGIDSDAAWVDAAWIVTAPDDELLDRHGRWYIADRDPDVLRRTALVVLGNSGRADDESARHAIEVGGRSNSPVVRSHAVWAARRLGCDELVAHTRDDDDVAVRAEWELTP